MNKILILGLSATLALTSCASKVAQSQESEPREIASTLLESAEPITAKETVWQDLSLDQAFDKARAEGKLVFVDCYTKTCIPCKMMVEKVFPQEICGSYINAQFIPIMLDVEDGEGPAIAEKYRVEIYPTYLILNPDGRKVGEIIGADRDAARFIGSIKEIVDNIQD